jgi:hypothetical protein
MIVSRFVHFQKQYSPIEVTPDGTQINEMLEQPQNACSSNEETGQLLANSKEVIHVHPQKQ